MATTQPTATDIFSPVPPPPGVLLVGKCRVRETGNATTLERLRVHVLAGGWRCVTCDPDDLPDLPSLHRLVATNGVVAAVGLHAFRCSHVLLACHGVGVPYVLVCGGTDVNECVREAKKAVVMAGVVKTAAEVIAPSPTMRTLALEAWPFLEPSSVSILPQAVQVDPCPDFNMVHYLHRLQHHHRREAGDQFSCGSNLPCTENQNNNSPITDGNKLSNTSHIWCTNTLTENDLTAESDCLDSDGLFLQDRGSRQEALRETYQPLVLLVAGLRPVKDVLYVAEAWSTWHEARKGKGMLLIMGPVLNTQYAQHVHREAARLSGVRVSWSLPPRECQAVIHQAAVLVNSSISEGMPSTILEAMALGTPVVARDIPGNTSVVTHGQTGLLYSSPESFIAALDSLLQNPSLVAQLVSAARERVLRLHTLRQEQDEFLAILRRLVRRSCEHP